MHLVMVYIFPSNVRTVRRVGRRKEKTVVVIWLDQIQYWWISKLCVCPTNNPGNGQVLKYVHEVPGSDPIVNPISSCFLNNVLHLGPITNRHDLRTYFLYHMLRVRPSNLNRTLKCLRLWWLCNFGLDILSKAYSTRTVLMVRKFLYG